MNLYFKWLKCMVYELYFYKIVIKILSKYEITSKNKALAQNQFSQQLSSSEDLYLLCKCKENENYTTLIS